MVSVRIQVAGLAEIIRNVEQAGPMIQRELTRAVRRAVLIVEAEAKSLAPRKTGTLQRSLHSEVRGLGRQIQGIVGTNLTYAPFVEFGTGIYHEPDAHKPWTVKPVNAKALAIPVATGAGGASPYMLPGKFDAKGRQLYRTAKGGSTMSQGRAQNVIFRRSVTIQGMKARSYLVQGFKNKRRDVETVFRQTLADINKSLAKGVSGAAQARGRIE